MTSSHDLHIAEGASLVHQLVTATITDEMTHLALHDPGVLSHVLVADGTLWVRDLGTLYQILHDFFEFQGVLSSISSCASLRHDLEPEFGEDTEQLVSLNGEGRVAVWKILGVRAH